MIRDSSYRFVSVPKLKMSENPGEDVLQVDLESSTYSQVVFIDVPRSYPLHTDVTCSYKLTGSLIANPKDWIGIYKVNTIILSVFSVDLAAYTFLTLREVCKYL